MDKNPEVVINNTTDETNKTSDYIVGEFAVDLSSRDDVLWTLPVSWGRTLVANGSNNVKVIDGSGTDITATVGELYYVKLVDGTYNFAGGDNGDLSGKSFSDSDIRAAFIGDAALNTGIYSYLKEGRRHLAANHSWLHRAKHCEQRNFDCRKLARISLCN